MRILAALIILILNPLENIHGVNKLDFIFSYDFNELITNDLAQVCWIKEEFIQPIQSRRNDTMGKIVHQPKVTLPQPLLKGEGSHSYLEASPIKGTKPKIIYRNEHFIRSHFIGKWYTTPRSYILFGGSKPSYWRSNPNDLGVYVGQGMEF